jgi:hypothetical protein
VLLVEPLALPVVSPPPEHPLTSKPMERIAAQAPVGVMGRANLRMTNSSA